MVLLVFILMIPEAKAQDLLLYTDVSFFRFDQHGLYGKNGKHDKYRIEETARSTLYIL